MSSLRLELPPPFWRVCARYDRVLVMLNIISKKLDRLQGVRIPRGLRPHTNQARIAPGAAGWRGLCSVRSARPVADVRRPPVGVMVSPPRHVDILCLIGPGLSPPPPLVAPRPQHAAANRPDRPVHVGITISIPPTRLAQPSRPPPQRHGRPLPPTSPGAISAATSGPNHGGDARESWGGGEGPTSYRGVGRGILARSCTGPHALMIYKMKTSLLMHCDDTTWLE